MTLINSRILGQIKDRMKANRQIFRTISGVQESDSKIKIPIKIHKIEKEIDAHVIKNGKFSYDILLGLDVIKKFHLLQDDNLNIFQRLHNGKIEKIIDYKDEISINKKEERPTRINFSETQLELNHLDAEKKEQLQLLIKKNTSSFAENKYDIGQVKDHEAHIKLLENKYISRKPYRCSISDQNEIESQVTKLLEKRLIEESRSPFAAPVTLAYKKEDGKRTRLCIDFRELNKILIPESQPFPRIEDTVVKTRNCKWYTVLDINSAFWSIPVREKDRYKTAFVTQSGHYQWNCLPFGLKISPAIFQRVLANSIRRNGLQDFCVNYIDDILIFSKNFEDHMQHIKKVMLIIKEEGFRLKLSKCNFAQHTVKYLGHILGNNTVRPHHDNLKSIREFPTPEKKKNIRQFLGKINFYHKYIPNSTKSLEPLHALLRNNTPFKWTEECEISFKNIKEYLCKSPILAIFDPDRSTFIYTDASGLGLGAILKQTQDDGELHPVAYFSKKLTPTQRKKKAIYLECLAIKEAIQYWQHWLLGHKFVVVSDHKPLENLKVKSRTDEELGDMVYYLSQYEFNITYSPGKNNQEADALSRNPVIESFEEMDDNLQIVNLISIEDLQQDQQRNKERLSLTKDVIKKGNLMYKQLRNRERIFISQEMGLSIIKKIHSHYGHIGVGHIAAKLRPFYYCREMDKLIKKFCNECDICKKNKSRRCREIGALSQLGPATEPYEIMSLDTIGGFARNRSPKKYLHVLADHFSRYAYVYPSANQQAKDFIKLLEPIVKKNKIKILLADQYAGINSKEFQSFLKRHHIKMIFSATDCPFSNGLNERLNQTLVNRIRCKIQENKNQPWSKVAMKCTDEYNSTIHSVTKFSPLYLLRGKEESILPSELQIQRDLTEDRKQAIENSLKYHRVNKTRVDKKKKNIILKENDMVYVERGNKLNRNKLDPIRSGPYKIINKISKTIYEVEDEKNRQPKLYHISKLIPNPTGAISNSTNFFPRREM